MFSVLDVISAYMMHIFISMEKMHASNVFQKSQ